MESASEVKLSTLSKKMETIAKNYFFARNILLKRIELSDDNFLLMIVYMQHIHACYAKLDDSEKQFINNEFFYQDYPNWWKNKLTPSTYIRLKTKSIRHFLEVYYVSF